MAKTRRTARQSIAWRVASGLAAVAVAATVLSGVGPARIEEPASALPPPQAPPAVSCNVGLLGIDLWRWACAAPNGNYWAWWAAPRAWPNPHLDPADQALQASQINPAGAVSGDTTNPDQVQETFDATIDYIWGVGSRGMPGTSAAQYPHSWDAAAAAPQLARYVDTSGLTAVQWLQDNVTASCPTTVANAAKAGYALSGVGEPTTYGDCNLQDIVINSLDPATGQFGTGLDDTIWAVLATVSWGSNLSYDGGIVVDYLEAQINDLGAWGPDGAVDFQATSLAVQALLALGVAADDPTFSGAVDAVAAEQILGSFDNVKNEFGEFESGIGYDFCGFGDKETGNLITLDTAHVHGMFHVLFNAGQSLGVEFWTRLGAGGIASGRNCLEHALGNVLQNQRRTSDGKLNSAAIEDPLAESRFYVDSDEKNALSLSQDEYNNLPPEDQAGGPPITAEAAQANNTRPTSVTMFYTYFFHPVAATTSDVEGVAAADQNVPTAVQATPTVTG